MNSRIKQSLSGTEPRFWIPRFLLVSLLAFGFAGWLVAGEQHASPDLTIHEWGTFTAIAGKDGRAVEWLPLTGSTDLPQFVEHLSSVNFKQGLRGTISHGDTGTVFLLSTGCHRSGESRFLAGTHHRVVSPCNSC